MSKKLILAVTVFTCLLAGRPGSLQAQRSDTLYFNAGWQICEKPFAAYYRFGQIRIDTVWYYAGKVQDFYMNNKIAMDGNYSSSGEKEGVFWFFYENGLPRAKGTYHDNKRVNTWEFFYEEGGLMTRIDYKDGIQEYIVLDYVDSTGKTKLKDSSGRFTLPIGLKGSNFLYELEGEYKNGKRDGTWKYSFYSTVSTFRSLVYKEIYDDGVFKKGVNMNVYGTSKSYKEPVSTVVMMPEFMSLRMTEQFRKDPTSFRNKYDDQDLVDYLVNRKSPGFEVDGESFSDSYSGVIKTLNTRLVLQHFSDKNKFYKGEILFNVSDSGDIEEAEISGNLTETEKEKMLFFVRKFKNIKEILVENVIIDAYHKVYFYTVIFAEFVPPRYLYQFPETEFIFAAVPYEKLKQLVKEANGKKKKKKNN